MALLVSLKPTPRALRHRLVLRVMTTQQVWLLFPRSPPSSREISLPYGFSIARLALISSHA